MLEEKVKEFEGKFAKVESKATLEGDKTMPMVHSGGTVPWESISPALYSSEERAITAWLKEASQYPAEHDMLEWIMKPELTKYQITMADSKQRHRMVSDRYNVKAQFITRRIDG